MRPSLSGVQISVLTWASLWMLVAPLFHVHPDADHLHGKAGHNHSGTVHAVWSPDLDCEMDDHEPVVAKHGNAHGVDANYRASGHRHLEIGFSLLIDSLDRKSFRSFITQELGCSSIIALDEGGAVRIQEHLPLVFSSLQPSRTSAARAPPNSLIT